MPRSERLRHETACSLFEEGHYIADEFVDVIEEVEFSVDGSYDYGASGCGSCFHTDADAAVFWVAQGDASERVALKFDVDDDAAITRQDLGGMICKAAEECHVPYSWNGDPQKCVILGEEDEYTNLPPGTAVTKSRYSSTRHGVVVDASAVNPDCEYQVMKNAPDIGNGGDKVAEFKDREDAEEFAGDDLDVQHATQYGQRDGRVIVQWEGETRFNVEQVKDLDYEID